MSNCVPLERPPRVLFFGMQGNFSLPPLHTLLDKGIEVCAIVIPASWNSFDHQSAIWLKEPVRMGRLPLPLLNSSLHNSIIQLAEAQRIPTWEVARLSDPATVAILRAYQPDVLCVACFSLRLPRVILDIPRFGCLNVHPSRLPANRGPDPLFWTLREGKHQTAVTIHFMDEGMDTGDIVAQTIVDIPDGIRYMQLEIQCATQGGYLLAQAVCDVYKGLATSFPQDEAKSDYRSSPLYKDYVVTVADWSARNVYNFVRGIATVEEPVALIVDDKTVYVRDANSYSHDFEAGNNNEHSIWRGDDLWIRCKDGWVAVVQR